MHQKKCEAMSIFLDVISGASRSRDPDPISNCTMRRAADLLPRSRRRNAARVVRGCNGAFTGRSKRRKSPCYAGRMKDLSALSDDELLRGIESLLGS